MKEEPSISSSKSKLSIFQSIFTLFSSIVGIGIFMSVSPTFKVFSTNNLFMVVLWWVIGSLISLIGALCYAELGRKFPQSGGEMYYYYHCLNPKFSTTFVIMYCFVIKTLTLAALSITATKYGIDAICPDYKHVYLIKRLSAIGLLLLCFTFNCISKNLFQKIGLFFFGMKLVLLLIVIGFGGYYMVKGNVNDWKKPLDVRGFSLVALGTAFINIFWSFEGWNSLGLIAGNVDNPKSNLKKATIIAIPLVSLMYILTVIGYCSVLGFDTVKNSDGVGLVFASVTLKKVYWIIPLLVVFSALGSINANFYLTADTIVAAARLKLLPGIFSLVYSKTNTAIISLCFILLISVLSTCLDFSTLLQYCAFVTWVFYFISFSCLWKTKLTPTKCVNTESHLEVLECVTADGFEINYFFIIIAQLVCVFVVGMCFYFSLIGCSVILIIMLFIHFIQYVPRNNSFFTKLLQFDEKLTKSFQSAGFVVDQIDNDNKKGESEKK